ncbi:hypothetical protein KR009_009542, partial [Drosophila setifemur]
FFSLVPIFIEFLKILELIWLLCDFRKWIINCNYRLYQIWRHLYGEPDWSDVVIFNEQPTCCPRIHSEPVCLKRICEICRTKRLVLYIDRAKYSIDIAHLTFSHRFLFNALTEAYNRGVRVRLVSDSQMMSVRGSVVSRLWEMGIPIHIAPPRSLMHHKFAIFDGATRIHQMDMEDRRPTSRLWRSSGCVMTGSLNWTKQGTSRNYENVVVSSNHRASETYQAVFDELWQRFEPMTNTD